MLRWCFGSGVKGLWSLPARLRAKQAEVGEVAFCPSKSAHINGGFTMSE